MDSDLEACGIKTIADVEFSFHIFDSDSWNDYFNSEMIRLETSAAAGYEYAYDESGTALYDENGIRIVAKGLSDNDSIFGPGLILYIYNGSDRCITVQTRDTSANGFMISSIFSCDVMPGKHAIDAVTFMSSDLEKNEIERITELDFKLHIFDEESWQDIVTTDTITLNFD